MEKEAQRNQKIKKRGNKVKTLKIEEDDKNIKPGILKFKSAHA